MTSAGDDMAGTGPLGFTFGTESDGWPIAVRPDWDVYDLLAEWLYDYNEPDDVAEILAGIDAVMAGTAASYRAHYNDALMIVEPQGFTLIWSLPAPHRATYETGSLSDLRSLVLAWAEHLDAIGWTGSD